MPAVTPFERAIERATGESVDDIRALPIDERRARIQKKHKLTMRFVKHFPFIGRGTVMGDRTKTHIEVEAELDKACR